MSIYESLIDAKLCYGKSGERTVLQVTELTLCCVFGFPIDLDWPRSVADRTTLRDTARGRARTVPLYKCRIPRDS